jgi:peroxiredoxin
MAAYREGEGVCERALFVVDKQGKIFWSYYSPIAVNPGADGSLEALERMNGIKSDVQTESANYSG